MSDREQIDYLFSNVLEMKKKLELEQEMRAQNLRNVEL